MPWHGPFMLGKHRRTPPYMFTEEVALRPCSRVAICGYPPADEGILELTATADMPDEARAAAQNHRSAFLRIR